MSFMCQKDSYLKEFDTRVKSCTATKKKNAEGYNIILEDTILFPEGGGQPSDWGTINEVSCNDIKRVGAEAIHFTNTEMLEGSEVKLKVNWERRFDHMQQHTAQHLITATTDHMFGFQTTSWDIGVHPNVVSIELNTPSITANQLQDIEEAANESLRNNASVTPSFYKDRDDPELSKFRGLGLPDDHVGVVRVLTIDGLDNALCCGTHVSHLAHIQAIKIMGAEKGKKGKTNVMFLAGKRLLHYTQTCYDREKKLTGILKGPGNKHCELAEKAVKHSKTLQKTCTTLGRELATLEAKMFNQSDEKNSVFVRHRKDGDQDYISVLLAELGDEALPKLITTGDDKEGGMFVLAGPPQLLQDLGPKLCEVFGGKGAASRGAYRGKAVKPDKGRAKAEALVREYLAGKEDSQEVEDQKEVEDRDESETQDSTGQEDSQEVEYQEEVEDRDESETQDSTDSESGVKDESIKEEKDSSPESTSKSPKSKTKQRKSAAKVVGKRVVVSNIPYELSCQDLKDKFREEIGEVTRVELLQTPDGKSQGMAAVEFSDPEHAMQAIELFHNRKIMDRSIKVREELGNDRYKLMHSRMKAAKAVGVLGPAPGSLSGLGSGMTPLLHQLELEESCTVSVANLDVRVTFQKLKHVFKLAGQVVKVDVKGDKSRTGTVTFEHPIEAMQAVSMFDNQVLFDRKMSVKMGTVGDAGAKLPIGLKSIGRGLGLGGAPISSHNLNGSCINGSGLSLSDQLLQQQEYALSGRLYGGSTAGLQSLMGNGMGNMGNLGNMGNMGNIGNQGHLSNIGSGGVGLRGGGDQSCGPCCLAVKNLAFTSDWKALREHFRDVGDVKYAEVMYYRNGKSKGVGYVRFASFEEAQRAMMLKHKTRLDKRIIDVKFKK